MQLPSSHMQSKDKLATITNQASVPRKSRVFSSIHLSGFKQKHSQTELLKRLPFNRVVESSRHFRKVVQSKMFPYFVTVFLWTFLVISVALDLNFSVAVTGAMAYGGFKVIMFFHLMMLFFSVVLCSIFYGIRREGIAEKFSMHLSLLTLFFSSVNISLHFVDELVFLMKATEVVAWSLFNIVFSVSVYKILVVFLLPFLGRQAR